MTLPVIDRIRWRLGLNPLPLERRRRTTSTKSLQAKKTLAKTAQKPAFTTPMKTPEPTPVKTYGSIQHSADIYNASQMVVTSERLERLRQEKAAEETAERRNMAEREKAYKENLQARRVRREPQFGQQFGGIGMTDPKISQAVETWERELKTMFEFHNAKVNAILANASQHPAPIKMAHSL